jgi:DNA-binding response OmpR family regulator
VAKILIVDDQPQFRRALRIALVVKGYDIREAANGNDALDCVQSEHLDLILVDWLMLGMDGLGLCRAIRAASDVPIIMITSRRGGRPAALAAGANDYVSKPFAVDELLVHIESALTK